MVNIHNHRLFNGGAPPDMLVLRLLPPDRPADPPPPSGRTRTAAQIRTIPATGMHAEGFQVAISNADHARGRNTSLLKVLTEKEARDVARPGSALSH